jgi:hypothetical protein
MKDKLIKRVQGTVGCVKNRQLDPALSPTLLPLISRCTCILLLSCQDSLVRNQGARGLVFFSPDDATGGFFDECGHIAHLGTLIRQCLELFERLFQW